MDATIMPSMRSLIKRLQADFPAITIKASDEFRWSAAQRTVYVNPGAPHGVEYLLHEISHAVLDHRGYERDIDLLKLERDAWQHAQSVLARLYGVVVDDEIVQDNLDTYRHWLHSRSRCPACDTVGIQKRDRLYECVACGHTWRVNDAKLCALRRYSLNTK